MKTDVLTEKQKLSADEIRRIADLARIEISEEEKEKYSKELSAILEYIEQLKEVNTDDVSPTAQVSGLVNIVREDKADRPDVDERKRILDCVPEREGDYIKVKAIM